eukprot:TRINITY_DN14182_c0_g1_i3.p1 TRINITY_DN14182_c0_g1~~TRINITY_DN14182_c0_g1_i3.p1  ORF type:complete len:746 (+),score=120.91 TRINITY_DN14182_c0_g1_i3:44-2239(+)
MALRRSLATRYPAKRVKMTKQEALGMVFHQRWEGKEFEGVERQRTPRDIEELTKDQKRAVEMACVGRKNLFVGGQVGWGKTETLLQIKSVMEAKGLRVGLFSMGLRKNTALGPGETSLPFALKVGHRPISFLWVNQGAPNTFLANMRRYAKDFLSNYDILLIDDMEQADHDVWRTIRIGLTNVNLHGVDHTYAGDPFGGLQVVAAGDFLSTEQGSFERLNAGNHAFDEVGWERTFPTSIELRGKDDQHLSFVHEPTYSKFLTRLRFGELTKEDLSRLKSLINPNPRVTAVPEPYRDPLHHRTVPLPIVNLKRETGFTSFGHLQDHKGYRAAYRKVENGIPNCKVYGVFFEGPTGMEVLKAEPVEKLTMFLKQMVKYRLHRYGPQSLMTSADAKQQGLFYPSTNQSFTLNEDVILLEPMMQYGIAAGQRGIIKQLQEDCIVVDFNGQELPVHRFTVTETITPEDCPTIKQHHIEEATRELVFKATYSFFPLSHIKTLSTSDLFMDPMLNGFVADNKTTTSIDLSSMWTGSLRSLYSAMAHAKSFESVEITHIHNPDETLSQAYQALFESRHDDKNLFCYLPARLFHLRGLADYDIKKETCPVCHTPLKVQCPMVAKGEPVVSSLSLDARIRHCAMEYEYCAETKQTMTKSEFMFHSRDMAWVKCECGDLVRYKDLPEHREKYVRGTTCMGSGTGGTAPAEIEALAAEMDGANPDADRDSEEEEAKERGGVDV